MNRGYQLLDKGGKSAVANTCGITGRPDKVLQDRPANRADDHARLPLAIREAEASGPFDAGAIRDLYNAVPVASVPSSRGLPVATRARSSR